MQLIEAILDDLKAAAAEWHNAEISKEEFNLKMDLLAARIEEIRIDYEAVHIYAWQGKFSQLLFQTRFKAIEALRELQRTEDKRSFNNKIRWILQTKLYFQSLHRTVEASTQAYQFKADFYLKPHSQIFVLKGGETDE